MKALRLAVVTWVLAAAPASAHEGAGHCTRALHAEIDAVVAEGREPFWSVDGRRACAAVERLERLVAYPRAVLGPVCGEALAPELARIAARVQAEGRIRLCAKAPTSADGAGRGTMPAR